jgi:hypothetical protein
MKTKCILCRAVKLPAFSESFNAFHTCPACLHRFARIRSVWADAEQTNEEIRARFSLAHPAMRRLAVLFGKRPKQGGGKVEV